MPAGSAADASADAQDDARVDPLASVVQCDPLALPLAAFTDVTSDYGFDTAQPHALCAGVADLDGDLRDDLVVIPLYQGGLGASVHAVLLGPSGPKHVYSTVDTAKLVPDLGCALFDHDGDGHIDLWLGGHAGVAVYRNDGTGKFTDVSQTVLPSLLDAQASSFAPGDLDGDGDLDVVVGAGTHPTDCAALSCDFAGAEFTCQVSPPPQATSASRERVLIRQPAGEYTDASERWALPQVTGFATFVSLWDLDLDGDLDLLMGTDFGRPQVLMRGAAGFSGLSSQGGLRPYANAMGWGVGDFDGDGLLDLMLADLGATSLYRQTKSAGGTPRFVDTSAQGPIAALTVGTSSWTPVVADFDHDGSEDIALGVSLALPKPAFLAALDGCAKAPWSGHNLTLLFLNDGDGRWRAARTSADDCGEVVGVAQSAVDIDSDGDLDLLQVRPGCPHGKPVVRVLRNDLAKHGGAVVLRLAGRGGNTQAIGARVTALVAGVRRQRQVVGSSGLGGGGHATVHFGVGSAGQAVDVTVHWPGGGTTGLGTLPAGSRVLVSQP